MIRINRATEYGLMALRHMSQKSIKDPLEVTSAREVADRYCLPFDATAKTLQRLKEAGLIESAHGAKGGYMLLRPLRQISLVEFLEQMEGPQTVVGCAGSSDETRGLDCEYGTKCEIHTFMAHVNHRVLSALSNIQLDELTQLKVE